MPLRLRIICVALMVTIVIAIGALSRWQDARHAFEVIFFAAQTAILGVAVAALIYARGQVEEARELRSAQLQQARATFLLELDSRWESDRIRQAASLFARMRREEIQKAGKNDPHLNDEQKRHYAAITFNDQLNIIRSSTELQDLEKYRSLIGLAGFVETMGVMVKRGYVPAEDINELLGGPVLDFGTFFARHINERQNETGVLKGLFENALDLVERIKQLRS